MITFSHSYTIDDIEIASLNLDIEMDENTSNNLEKINADSEFVEFVLEYDGLKNSREVDVIQAIDKKKKEGQWKKIKRRLKKTYGEGWKDRWQDMKKQMKGLEKAKQRVGVFGTDQLEPKRKKPKATIWKTVFILRVYFIELTGRPNWKLIADILAPYYKEETLTYSDLSSWWFHRKGDFKDWDGKTFYGSIHSFYIKHKNDISKEKKEEL